jgi:hypothetical protein
MIDQIPTRSRAGWGQIDAEHDTADADKVLGHPMLADLLRLWSGLCRNGEPPAREDLDDLILKPGIFPQIRLLEGVERHGRRDLRYRLIGIGQGSTLGDDVTGRYVRDVFADETYADELIASAFLAIDGRRPIATRGRYVSAGASGAPTMVYRLGLPLKKLPSGTPLLLVCQMWVCNGEIVGRPVREPQVYEHETTIAFTDRSPGRNSPK